MKRAWCVMLLVLVALLPQGCVPLTFSREAPIDFDVYRHVAVQVSVHGLGSYYDDQSATVYLASELQADSGFDTVSIGDTGSADLILSVSVTLTELVDTSGDNPDYEYQADASFRAVDPSGNEIDSGYVSDSSEHPGEALEDALDEVTLHYLRPYRL